MLYVTGEMVGPTDSTDSHPLREFSSSDSPMATLPSRPLTEGEVTSHAARDHGHDDHPMDPIDGASAGSSCTTASAVGNRHRRAPADVTASRPVYASSSSTSPMAAMPSRPLFEVEVTSHAARDLDHVDHPMESVDGASAGASRTTASAVENRHRRAPADVTTSRPVHALSSPTSPMVALPSRPVHASSSTTSSLAALPSRPRVVDGFDVQVPIVDALECVDARPAAPTATSHRSRRAAADAQGHDVSSAAANPSSPGGDPSSRHKAKQPPRPTDKTSPITDDPWGRFAAERAAAAKAPRTKDVGAHRPSMADLRPLLAKHAAGQLTFHDTLPIQGHDKREVIGWLHMATGQLTKSLNEDAMMSSLLHDNQSTVDGAILVDVIKCERDLKNRVVRWGVASMTALNRLEGVTMKLRINRAGAKGATTTFESFSMDLPHALDGFYLDIPNGLQGQLDERLLFEAMSRLEPRFLWGSYTSVSATTGLAGSRYRLHFLGSDIPSSMLVGDRMVEEFVLRGRCLRAYGRGWFFRDHQLARINLDVPTPPNNPPPVMRPAESTVSKTSQPKAAKKQKAATRDTTEFTEVRRKKVPRSSNTQPHPPQGLVGRPWTSPNAFAALAERWTVGYTYHTLSDDDVSSTTIIPAPEAHAADLHHDTAGEFVTCMNIDAGTPTATVVPLDDLLADLAVLDAASHLAVSAHQAEVEAAHTDSHFDMAALVNAVRVDTLCGHLSSHPVEFGLQLHHLFAHDRPTFELFVRQRLLHRWLRATWGGTSSFDRLYTQTFGTVASKVHIVELFVSLVFPDDHETLTTDTADGDELSLSRFDFELVLAIAEVLLAVHGPLFFNSEAALMATTGALVGVIASHGAMRCLSSDTMATVLLTTQLGSELWRLLEEVYASDEDMQRILATLYDMHELGKCDLTNLGQVQVIPGTLLDPVSTFTLTTCNLNGLQSNGHLVAKRLRSAPSCLFLQETKLNNAKQLATFHHHLDNEVGVDNYRLFVNDLRSSNADSIRHRQCGVASLFHSSMPGFATIQHLQHLDVPGRYLVTRSTWSGLPVYFHNMYAPVESHLRRDFFADLPRDFEPNSLHLVGGDFNLPIDSTLDTASPHPRHSSGKVECVEWLAAIRVIDAWRLFNPHERLYSGPGRVNRLDYLFIDHDLATNMCSSAAYLPNTLGGDHLRHSVTLSHTQSHSSPGYWRLPRELLTDANIRLGIQQEASRLLEKMTSAPTANHGAMWYGWLKRMKAQLIKCHRQFLEANSMTLHHLQLKVAAAKRAFEVTGVGAADIGAAKLALDAASAEHRQQAMDRQFDFHANTNERGTSHFFRRPQGTKVPITCVTVGDTTVTDEATVHTTFTAHWRRIMTTDDDQPPPLLERRRAVLSSLSKRLDPADRDELDSPITAAELCAALKTMDPKKSPGPDGWSAGFFQVAPDVFSQLLHLVFHYQLTHHGQLLPQQRCSAVALLYKSGNRGDPGNYRPIALMAVEVKVLSRAMAFRLAGYATKLVDPSQAGFVPGRRLHDHVLPTDRYRPLLRQTWQYDPRVGLGIPHVASKLRVQRLLHLQRLMQHPETGSLPWKSLVCRHVLLTSLTRPPLVAGVYTGPAMESVVSGICSMSTEYGRLELSS
ncbi:hypothetical protein DYB34_005126 [Aphanomyces astaci]|uniref:Reverse transcriptase domain-containing protein n=1 Tax=Aphanomyces astaci TaxID=112090 RepID=A0A418BY83_APHAT|nr:hypothetical protein DYB34_005126 [Aphanomyces astaci]